MNIEQLEELRRGIALMRGSIEEDTTGSGEIQDALSKLEHVIMAELKNHVWGRYLEAEG